MYTNFEKHNLLKTQLFIKKKIKPKLKSQITDKIKITITKITNKKKIVNTKIKTELHKKW